jgi:hypothetical protein
MLRSSSWGVWEVDGVFDVVILVLSVVSLYVLYFGSVKLGKPIESSAAIPF